MASPAKRRSAAKRLSEPGHLAAAQKRPLAGKAFLVTGFEETKERLRICRLITDHGGSIVQEIPSLEVGPKSATGEAMHNTNMR